MSSSKRSGSPVNEPICPPSAITALSQTRCICTACQRTEVTYGRERRETHGIDVGEREVGKHGSAFSYTGPAQLCLCRGCELAVREQCTLRVTRRPLRMRYINIVPVIDVL